MLFSGGTKVAITGAGFGADTTVTFDGNNAAILEVDYDTIVCESPSVSLLLVTYR